MSGQGKDGFLSRWSRLKREGDKPPEPVALESVPAEAGPVEDEPFDPAKLEIPLPSLDDLKPGDSLKAFMQKGVPEVLKNAALRKMWALDPVVRDFRSEALDYAWDWNTPGGVPGTGPLGAADKVEEMIEAIFRPFETPQEEGEAASAAEEAPEPPAKPAEEAQMAAETAPSDPLPEAEQETQPRRRHGGALPQA